jgi:hypothetical protein
MGKFRISLYLSNKWTIYINSICFYSTHTYFDHNSEGVSYYVCWDTNVNIYTSGCYKEYIYIYMKTNETP